MSDPAVLASYVQGKSRTVALTLVQGTTPAAHLDDAAWPVELAIDAYGLRIALFASSRIALEGLHRATPPGARVIESPVTDARYSLLVSDRAGQPHRLYEDGSYVARGFDLPELVAALQSRLDFRVAVAARTRLFVHAGVVGWQGGAILVPGSSHSGKSSLVAALVRRGATYYSDEYAVLDDDGLVHPFPRPLGIRDSLGRSHQISPGSLGASIGERPLPVRLVVVTRHVLGATWSPRAIAAGEAVLALLSNTVAARSRPADTLRTLCAAVTTASAIRGHRGDAASVAEHILTHCTTP